MSGVVQLVGRRVCVGCGDIYLRLKASGIPGFVFCLFFLCVTKRPVGDYFVFFLGFSSRYWLSEHLHMLFLAGDGWQRSNLRR